MDCCIPDVCSWYAIIHAGVLTKQVIMHTIYNYKFNECNKQKSEFAVCISSSLFACLCTQVSMCMCVCNFVCHFLQASSL